MSTSAVVFWSGIAFFSALTIGLCVDKYYGLEIVKAGSMGARIAVGFFMAIFWTMLYRGEQEKAEEEKINQKLRS